MNLLLVSVDSLRLDHVSRTNPRLRTPRFDRLTHDFRFSDRLFSVSSVTRPVHHSLLTGLYPFEHGIVSQRSADATAGVPDLFQAFERGGGGAAALSEAGDVFGGLPWSHRVAALHPAAGPGLEQLGTILARAHPEPFLLFVHYWGAHAPYGAADGLAFGEVGRLLQEGRLQAVRERYARAVAGVFEQRLAPLLERLDPRRWTVVILGDHGESWTVEEPYHGQTLRNSVLRVPLYLRLPAAAQLTPGPGLLSMIDLFPTVCELFGLATGYRGYGRSIFDGDRDRVLAAQIEPTPGPDRPDRSGEGAALLAPRDLGSQWALFDAEQKFTWFAARGEGRLERTLTEELVEGADAARAFQERWQEMQLRAAYARRPRLEASDAERDLLERRLRDLGYLA